MLIHKKYFNSVLYFLSLIGTLLIFVTYEVKASSTMNSIEFEVIGDGNKTYVSASLLYDKYPKPIHLDVFNNLNDTGLLALKRYYASLKAGDVSKIKNQFFRPDGSHSKIAKLIKENPARFSKYQKLDKVEVLSKSLWGIYNIYLVRLYSKEQVMDWREELICLKDACFITRSLDNSDDNEKLFEAAYYFLTKRYKPVFLSKKQQREKIKQSGLFIIPSYDFTVSGSEPTLNFDIYPDIYPKNTYDFSIDKWVLNTTKISSELDVIAAMLTEIKKFKIENNDYSLLNPIIGKYWINAADNDFIIPLNRMKLSDKEQKKPEIVSMNYLLTAFYQTIQNWKAITPIGKLVSDKTTYIIVEVDGENSTSTMQVFSLSRKNGRYWMLLNNDDDTSAVMSNKAFIKLLFRWMQDRYK